jgi:hypothetical protein
VGDHLGKPATTMNATPHLNLCKAYLYASQPDQGRGRHHGRPSGPVVAISRQAGARGNSLADAKKGIAYPPPRR